MQAADIGSVYVHSTNCMHYKYRTIIVSPFIHWKWWFLLGFLNNLALSKEFSIQDEVIDAAVTLTPVNVIHSLPELGIKKE